MRINHNIAALNTYRQLNSASGAQSKSMEKLSSGMRINRAGDDAAGLAISEKMRGQIRGLDMASKNAQDANSLIATAEGALNETHDILQRMRELAVQSANDTNTDDDRKELQKEVSQLQTELTRISTDTNFNTKTLLNGDLSTAVTGTLENSDEAGSFKVLELGSLKENDTISIAQSVNYEDESEANEDDGALKNVTFSVTIGDNDTTEVVFSADDLSKGITSKELTVNGTTVSVGLKDAAALAEKTGNGDAAAAGTADEFTVGKDNSLTFHIGSDSGQSIKLAIGDMSASGLNVAGVDISSQSGADSAITTVNDAIKQVSAERSKLGAYQNRLEHTINNLSTSSENLTAAESRIRDVDMAKEMMEQTKNSILAQASQAMLAQANQQPQGVLQLLR